LLFPFVDILDNAHASFYSIKYCFSNISNSYFDSKEYLIAFGPCFLKFNHIDFFRRKKFLITIFLPTPLLNYVKGRFFFFYYIFIIMLCSVATRCRHLEGFEFARNDKEIFQYNVVYIYEKLPLER
jgi:hypothetical protein